MEHFWLGEIDSEFFVDAVPNLIVATDATLEDLSCHSDTGNLFFLFSDNPCSQSDIFGSFNVVTCKNSNIDLRLFILDGLNCTISNTLNSFLYVVSEWII